MRPSKRLDPIHPGEILLEDFMKPLALRINQLARGLDVPPSRIGAIVNGARSITADTALRLGTYFRVRRRPGSGFNSTTTFASFVIATGIGSSAAFARGRPPNPRPPLQPVRYHG
jgi:addiction module HigA family antidote